jgi:N-acyl-D-aspartate/D-glutamate deacylase
VAHDLVIEHARIIDGLGTPARDDSLAVREGRIAVISGDASGRERGAATQRVDTGGLAPAPGIVDIHTHYDAQLTWDPFATPSTASGSTASARWMSAASSATAAARDGCCGTSAHSTPA